MANLAPVTWFRYKHTRKKANVSAPHHSEYLVTGQCACEHEEGVEVVGPAPATHARAAVAEQPARAPLDNSTMSAGFLAGLHVLPNDAHTDAAAMDPVPQFCLVVSIDRVKLARRASA